jgi:acetolactate synthase-1/3 small subunit
VVAKGPERRESLRIADIFDATVADTTIESFVFSLTGKPEKLDAFIEPMRSLGKTEIARSGIVGIARGAKAL